jgi:2-hydroxychromene-2-carboxylate isomerase
MSKTIEFYFDVGSPTAYLAHTQLKKIADKYNANLVYEPILLGAVHKATNNTPPGLVPAKGRYMLTQDLPRYIKRYAVPFTMNRFFPVNTLTLMRGCYAAKKLDCFEQYVDLVFDAMWVKSLNMGDQAVLISTLQEAGIDAEKLLALTAEDSIKEALKATTSKAVEKGIFGAPTMFIGNNMYFGQDRLDFIEEELAGSDT